MIVRENLEDLYIGVMGDAKDLLGAGLASPRARLPKTFDEGRFAAKIITREGTERVAKFACDLALSRRGKLTVSAKTLNPESATVSLSSTSSSSNRRSGLSVP